MNKEKDEFKQDIPEREEAKEPSEQEIPLKESVEEEKIEGKNYEELWDRFLRLQAEFDNYRKRSFKEKSEFIKFANEGLIMELLGILDNFERGIQYAEKKKDFDLLHQGVDMISKQLHTLLEAKGLKRIPAKGEKFDPYKHEALEIVEDLSAEEERVIEELQPGYVLNGRIIRPSKVKVVKPAAVEKEIKEKEETIQENGKNQEV